MYDKKQAEFLAEENRSLRRQLDAAIGQLSKQSEQARIDHYLIIVLQETISDLRKELAAMQKLKEEVKRG
jgi:hypothetical protein